MSTAHDRAPKRTLHQINDAKGKPSVAAHTDPLWIDLAGGALFADPTKGNKIVPLTSGEKYFKDLIGACDAAQSEIYIAGWQVNWDALLAPGVRLYDLLYRNAMRGVKVYVMPWDDTEPVQSYDDQTKYALESINIALKKAKSQGSVHVNMCKSFATVNNNYFSHHQKQVVIDRAIAYVGGIDVCYGRFDDETYDLHPDAKGREMLNRYNPGVPMLQKVDEKSVTIVDPDLMKGAYDKLGADIPLVHVKVRSNAEIQMQHIAKGGWQVPYAKAGMVGIGANNSTVSANTPAYVTLDPKRQPRMPWQDVHCRIEGPAVADLLRNFIARWNATTGSEKLKAAPLPSSFPMPGKAEIQVLRSAPHAHCNAEVTANGAAALRGGKKAPTGTQHDIHTAMLALIAKARRFIYIENQFFVSDFGRIGSAARTLSPAAQYIKDGSGGISDTSLKMVRKLDQSSGPEGNDRLPQNQVLQALLKRFKASILDDAIQAKFHVYITLPVHPEGTVLDASVAVQVFFTMQSLVFGSQSLINGLRRLLKARELKDKQDANFLRVLEDGNDEYKTISTDSCNAHVTLLNLRNWDKFGNNYVTEQIYVHSKLMIVDDRYALLGSANINDRSLLGERDSEIAVLVLDGDSSRQDINGKGSKQPVRKFAHDLRVQIWSKLFGIAGAVRPAKHLQSAIDAPGHPESWAKIQKQATANAAYFDAAFEFIPRNTRKDPGADAELPAHIIPTWDASLKDPDDAKAKGLPSSPLPSQDAFWSQPRHSQVAAHLSEIKGFITALPVRWTEGENNWIQYPTSIIVDRGSKQDSWPDGKQIRVAEVSTLPLTQLIQQGKS
jgi:phospholipase D1/2